MEWVTGDPPIVPGYPLERDLLRATGASGSRVGIAVVVLKLLYQAYLAVTEDQDAEERINKLPFKLRGFYGGTFTLPEAAGELLEDLTGIPSDVVEQAVRIHREKWTNRSSLVILVDQAAQGSVVVAAMWRRDP